MNKDMEFLKKALRQALVFEMTIYDGMKIEDLADHLTTNIMEALSDVIAEVQVEMNRLRQENARLKAVS